MNERLDGELDRGRQLALALVQHLQEMGGAAQAIITVVLNDERYSVVVTHEPVEEN